MLLPDPRQATKPRPQREKQYHQLRYWVDPPENIKSLLDMIHLLFNQYYLINRRLICHDIIPIK